MDDKNVLKFLPTNIYLKYFEVFFFECIDKTVKKYKMRRIPLILQENNIYYYNNSDITDRKKIYNSLSRLLCTTPICNYNDKKRVVLHSILSSLTNIAIAPQSETILKVNNCDINLITEFSINQDCTYTVSRSKNTNDGNILWECYSFGNDVYQICHVEDGFIINYGENNITVEVSNSSKLPLNFTFKEEDGDYSHLPLSFLITLQILYLIVTTGILIILIMECSFN